MSKPLGGLLGAAFLFIFLLSSLGRVTAVPQKTQPQLPPGIFVARVYYSHIDQLQHLQEYDLWEYNNLGEKYVLLSLSGADYLHLQRSGWRLQVDQQQSERLNNPALNPFQDGYRTVDQIYQHLQQVNDQYPQLTELLTYGRGHCHQQGGCITLGGDSFGGYELRALRLSNEALSGSAIIEEGRISRGSKPVFVLVANIHAREISTAEIALHFIDWLLAGYGQDADLTWILDEHEIWIIPTANPEGHWLVELGESEKYGGLPFFQRKNLNLDTDNDQAVDCSVWPPSVSWQYGVDLNRNHSFAWGPPGSSDMACSQTFRGPQPASEAETAALQDLVADLIPDQRGPGENDAAAEDTQGILITLHSYSELILYPWGYSYQPAPNEAGLKAIAEKMAQSSGYVACRPGDCLYTANGTTDDWAYGALGIPAFTFEIGQSFMPPYEDVQEQLWPENKQALYYAAKIAQAPYMIIQGPDSSAVEVRIAAAGNNIEIWAVLDDSAHGGQTISAARVSINIPFTDDAALPLPMNAQDGSFDQVSEDVSLTIPLTRLPAGRNTVYLQGQDDLGNWGTTSAVFLTIPNSYSLFLPLFLPS